MPTTPLPDDPASGMWQLGLRYDTIDLNDGTSSRRHPDRRARSSACSAARWTRWTVGVNWYWRSNFKFMLNYVMVDSSQLLRPHLGRPYAEDPANNDRLVNGVVDDNPNILEARLQFYW